MIVDITMPKIIDTIKTHSTIIEGGKNTFLKLQSEIKEAKIDISVLEIDKLLVDDFRGLNSFFTLKHSNRKIVILYSSSIPEITQNMMLKHLEEGNDNVQLVILVPNISIFLPTVLSRVQVLKDLVDENVSKEEVSEILSLSLSQRLFLIKEMEEESRQDTYFFVNSFLSHLIQKGKAKEVERILEMMQIFLEGNINKKQFLQYFFTILPVI